MDEYRSNEENYVASEAQSSTSVNNSIYGKRSPARSKRLNYDRFDRDLARYPNPTSDEITRMLCDLGLTHYFLNFDGTVRPRHISTATEEKRREIFDNTVRFNNARKAKL